MSLEPNSQATDRETTEKREDHSDQYVAFITGIYVSVDNIIKSELDRLSTEEAVVPSCKKGCSLCCSQHIITNIAEVRTLAHFIRSNFSSEQMEALRIRVTEWHKWDDGRRGKNSLSQDINRDCPMLVDGNCGAYEARPLICRRFFVTSDPADCALNHELGTVKNGVSVIKPVISATETFEAQIKTHIETSGKDYLKSISLLPQGLAAEMKWKIDIC